MALTPADIHNVAFKRPKPLKRGYDEDEVDEFLDLVEQELTRLIEENNDLKAQVQRFEESGPSAAPAIESSQPPVAADAAATSATADSVEDAAAGTPAVVTPQRVAGEVTAPVTAEVTPAAEPAGTVVAPSDVPEHVQALSVLSLARETADKHLTAATQEAEKARREARAEITRLIDEAQARADSLQGEAKTAADTMHAEASSKAAALTEEAERKHREVLGDLESRKIIIESEIASLRDFERRFHERMKSYLEEQLHDLDEHEPAEPPDAPDGADQAARHVDRRQSVGSGAGRNADRQPTGSTGDST
jgi:DivIVA domain-containing protein